ncbi:hypothetical protein MPUL_06580 [Mycolicibacterium pulveris]|uniref:Uncharacterized protein n=1 Tax=Mycolicibacterium pulveris TaxID=36813 RepID=A0A7I7UEJ5_MYCPV|nr:hypothetical protein MPUL_06580 [Mycolicibacterium pulveris]
MAQRSAGHRYNIVKTQRAACRTVPRRRGCAFGWLHRGHKTPMSPQSSARPDRVSSAIWVGIVVGLFALLLVYAIFAAF